MGIHFLTEKEKEKEKTILYSKLVSGETFMIHGEDLEDVYLVTDKESYSVNLKSGVMTLFHHIKVIPVDLEAKIIIK